MTKPIEELIGWTSTGKTIARWMTPDGELRTHATVSDLVHYLRAVDYQAPFAVLEAAIRLHARQQEGEFDE